MKQTGWMILLVLLVSACQRSAPKQDPKTLPETKKQLSPEKRYGALFEAVQMGDVFPDSKTFVDCTPRFATDYILQEFEKVRFQPEFSLKSFVKTHFELPFAHSSNFHSDTSRSVAEHINVLWEVLTREADSATVGTLLPLPKPYIVPGGRFGEVYYWDSYFTILGLQTAERWDLIEHMADNFSYLIETQGFVPNGNRTYYQSRSQPPFYSLIIRVLAEHKGAEVLVKYLPFLEKEYLFWMEGMRDLSADAPTHRRVVRLESGDILNRYYDDQAAPRPESYREDVGLVQGTKREAVQVYRDLRAACESGWDFSSRWFADGNYLASIHTTEIIPVDLNALLYHLESTIADAYLQDDNEEKGAFYQQRAQNRKRALLNFCWDEKKQFFYDYDFIARRSTRIPSLAAVYPLFFGMATEAQASGVAQVIVRDFLKPGGLVTTLDETGQQWDAPNGWAPLQWMGIQGLRNYQQNELADSIRSNWIDLNIKVYKNTGKMVEKYNVLDVSLEAGGGEYPVQDGFGWTNGVLLRLLSERETLEK